MKKMYQIAQRVNVIQGCNIQIDGIYPTGGGTVVDCHYFLGKLYVLVQFDVPPFSGYRLWCYESVTGSKLIIHSGEEPIDIYDVSEMD